MSPRAAIGRSGGAGSGSSVGGGSSGSGANSAQMQKMLTTYKREIERLKTENREVRARGSVAERGYRAVMAENERLCNKLEHLEEIFVNQARQTPWPKEAKSAAPAAGPEAAAGSGAGASAGAGGGVVTRIGIETSSCDI